MRREEADGDESRDRQDLENHERVLRRRAGSHAQRVDCREERDRDDAATSPLESCQPVSGAKYVANVTAAAAIPPLCETSNSVQPYIKASDG